MEMLNSESLPPSLHTSEPNSVVGQADIPAYHKTLTLFNAIQIPGNLWAVGKHSELEKHQKQQPIQAAPTKLQSLAKNREATGSQTVCFIASL